jgi:hypothetical protein
MSGFARAYYLVKRGMHGVRLAPLPWLADLSKSGGTAVAEQPRAPIDLAHFRAGRRWHVWGRHWEITCCHVDDEAAGTTLNLDLQESATTPDDDAVEGHGPFYAGRQAWAIVDTEWDSQADCHALRIQMQRTQEQDRPHPVVAALFRLRVSP